MKGTNQSVKQERASLGNRVLDYFHDKLPTPDLLVFLDDTDWAEFRKFYGAANRGFFALTHKHAYYQRNKQVPWPPYMASQLVKLDRVSQKVSFPYDAAIYLYGSTCRDQTSLTMTLAHELQHFIQYGSDSVTWALNTLIPSLQREVIAARGIIWPDIPIEREARIVSKRAAQAIVGSENTDLHIESRLREASSSDEIADWEFIRDVDTTQEYGDLPRHTRRLFKERLTPVRKELENVLVDAKKDPKFPTIDLEMMF